MFVFSWFSVPMLMLCLLIMSVYSPVHIHGVRVYPICFVHTPTTSPRLVSGCDRFADRTDRCWLVGWFVRSFVGFVGFPTTYYTCCACCAHFSPPPPLFPLPPPYHNQHNAPARAPAARVRMLLKTAAARAHPRRAFLHIAHTLPSLLRTAYLCAAHVHARCRDFPPLLPPPCAHLLRAYTHHIVRAVPLRLPRRVCCARRVRTARARALHTPNPLGILPLTCDLSPFSSPSVSSSSVVVGSVGWEDRG